jgi:hypothetical protein
MGQHHHQTDVNGQPATAALSLLPHPLAAATLCVLKETCQDPLVLLALLPRLVEGEGVMSFTAFSRLRHRRHRPLRSYSLTYCSVAAIAALAASTL